MTGTTFCLETICQRDEQSAVAVSILECSCADNRIRVFAPVEFIVQPTANRDSDGRLSCISRLCPLARLL